VEGVVIPLTLQDRNSTHCRFFDSCAGIKDRNPHDGKDRAGSWVGLQLLQRDHNFLFY